MSERIICRLIAAALLLFVAACGDTQERVGPLTPPTWDVRFEAGVGLDRDLVMELVREHFAGLDFTFTHSEGEALPLDDAAEDQVMCVQDRPMYLDIGVRILGRAMIGRGGHVCGGLGVFYLAGDSERMIAVVVAHEIGHTYGLQHSETPGDIMHFTPNAASYHEFSEESRERLSR